MLNLTRVLISLTVLAVLAAIAIGIHQPPNPTVVGFPKEVNRSVPVELYYSEFREEFAAEIKRLNRDGRIHRKWGLLVLLERDDHGRGLIKVSGTRLGKGASDQAYLLTQVDLTDTNFPGHPRDYARIAASRIFEVLSQIDEREERDELELPKASIDAGAPVTRALLF